MSFQGEGSPTKSSRTLYTKGRIMGGFVIDGHIGSGGYADIYVAQDPKLRITAALKVEEKGQAKTAIENEKKVFEKIQGSKYFPKLIRTSETDKCKYIAMELLGPSLSTMKKILSAQRFTPQSTIKLARQMLCCIQALHNKGIIHRDIKPGNFLLRGDITYPVVLMDFGLCRFIIDENGNHIQPRPKSGFTGTPKYASPNAHAKKDLSRRDDLISWFYSIIELVEGKLPWSGVKDDEKILNLKINTSVQVLCNSLPEEFRRIYHIINNLEFDEKPDYDLILDLLGKASMRAHCEESEYEWYSIPQDRIKRISKIDIVPPSFVRPTLIGEKPPTAIVNKPRLPGEFIAPPIEHDLNQAKKEKSGIDDEEEDSIGLEPLDVRGYQMSLPQNPFTSSGPTGGLPPSPKKRRPVDPRRKHKNKDDEYDDSEEAGCWKPKRKEKKKKDKKEKDEDKEDKKDKKKDKKEKGENKKEKDENKKDKKEKKDK